MIKQVVDRLSKSLHLEVKPKVTTPDNYFGKKAVCENYGKHIRSHLSQECFKQSSWVLTCLF